MAGGRYNEEQKRQALEALMASAVLNMDGIYVPNTHAVSETVEIHRRTLNRWWDARDRDKDAQLRAAALHAREDLTRNGATDWYSQKLAEARTLADHLLNPATYRDLDGDKEARLFKLTMDGMKDLQTQLTLAEGDTRKGKRSRLKLAAKQVGILKARQAEQDKRRKK